MTEASPRVSIRLGDLVHIGQDAVDHNFDPSRPAGEEIEVVAKGMRTLAVDLQSFAPTTVGAGTTARSVLAAAQAALSLPSVRNALNAAGLGLLEQGTVQRIPSNALSQVEDRATLPVRFAVSQSVSERTGYIETVIPTYGGGPVFLMEGAEDVAGLANFERWARADQPSFPRLVDGPRGRPGVQFSRIGADVVSGSARNVGHLRTFDLQSPESVRALVGEELTVAFWHRRDPTVVLAGVTTPTFRLLNIIGVQGPTVAAGAHFGITESSTGSLLLSTQTPTNVGGTSINGNTSTYVAGLAIGTWRHICVTLKRNGLDLLPVEVGATADWYLNGSAVFQEVGVGGTLSVGPRIPQWNLAPAPRYIAAVGAAWSNPNGQFVHGYDGSVADLVIYPRALSPAEVATLYTTGPFGLRV